MEKSLSILIEALEVAQLKGCYTLNEAVSIAQSIGKIQKFIESQNSESSLEEKDDDK